MGGWRRSEIIGLFVAVMATILMFLLLNELRVFTDAQNERSIAGIQQRSADQLRIDALIERMAAVEQGNERILRELERIEREERITQSKQEARIRACGLDGESP